MFEKIKMMTTKSDQQKGKKFLTGETFYAKVDLL